MDGVQKNLYLNLDNENLQQQKIIKDEILIRNKDPTNKNLHILKLIHLIVPEFSQWELSQLISRIDTQKGRRTKSLYTCGTKASNHFFFILQ